MADPQIGPDLGHRSKLGRFPGDVLAIALVLTGVSVGWLGWVAADSFRRSIERSDAHLEAQRHADRILYLDEVLSTSARQGVVTGEPSWEDRYRSLLPELRSAFERARTAAIDTEALGALERLHGTNEELVETELLAFELDRAGATDSARALLFGHRYHRLKEDYASGVRGFRRAIVAQLSARLETEWRTLMLSFAVAATALLLMGFAWFQTLRRLGRWRNALLRGMAELRRAERALRESEERYRGLAETLRETNDALEAIIEAAPLAIFSLDPDGTVRSWNPAAERIFGWSESEVVGRPLPIVPDPKRDEYGGFRERVLAGEPLMGLQIRRQREDGTPIDVELWAAPLHGSDGAVSGIMALVQDITERRDMERQLFLSQRLESVGRLAGGIAHDFNNVLTAILGNCELLLTDLAADDPHYTELEEIRRGARRAAELTRHLLAFSRRQMLRPQVIDLNAVVGEIERMLRRLIGEDIRLITRLDPELGSVRADPTQIEQVVMNLCVNARDAMPTGGHLTIETQNVELMDEYARAHVAVEPGSYVMLAVTDTGVGMESETMARIFEPFFTTKKKGQGTGLGLSTMYGIVKQSGGNVWVYSEPGKGTTFKVYLPRMSADPTPVEPEARSQPAVPTQPGGDSGTVLVVEDEASLRALVGEILRRNGFDVLPARDGEEAIRVLEDHSGAVDIALVDMVLPDKNGVEVAGAITEREPGVRIVYMSGYTEEGIVHRGMLTTSAAFLEKPFSANQLVTAIRDVLDSNETVSS